MELNDVFAIEFDYIQAKKEEGRREKGGRQGKRGGRERREEEENEEDEEDDMREREKVGEISQDNCAELCIQGNCDFSISLSEVLGIRTLTSIDYFLDIYIFNWYMFVDCTLKVLSRLLLIQRK